MNDTYEIFRSDSSEIIDLCKLAEVIIDRLYLATYSTQRRHQDEGDIHFFNFDRDEDDISRIYHCKFIDTNYGLEPPNLGYLAEYIRCINDKMYNNRYLYKTIVHCTTNDFRNYNNAALFIGTYAVKTCTYFIRDVTLGIYVY